MPPAALFLDAQSVSNVRFESESILERGIPAFLDFQIAALDSAQPISQRTGQLDKVGLPKFEPKRAPIDPRSVVSLFFHSSVPQHRSEQ